AKPENEVESVDVSELCHLYDTLEYLIGLRNTQVTEFNKQAELFKSKFAEEQITNDLKELKERGIELALSIQRFEKNDACIEYQQLSNDVEDLGNEIPRLRLELETEQTEFLEQYFAKINRYFNALGGREFALVHGINNQGNRPVNFFKVKFRGQDINESDLDKVFSESDRRSLGLAIYLSSLDALDTEELAKTVVVMDDPVTSFDDHRVGQTHKKLVELADRCEQLILLSHFKAGIVNFIKVHGFSRSDVRLIEIIKDHQSSRLQVGDSQSFIRTAHLENTHELIDFVERRTDKLSCKPRVYLEDVINLRFSKQIRKYAITNENLSNRIENLNNSGVVVDDIAAKLDHWRKELNPEHHVWLDDDIENQRTTVAEFLDFVFHELVPAK
ncbi:hypothetical protein AB6C72_25105, partial [Vibrio splendidus]